jgi:hypothetical protein
MHWFSLSLPFFIQAFLFCFLCHGNHSADALAADPLMTAQPPRVNPAITEFEPAMAIRASACITCHARIQPSYITDFGYGTPYFFGQRTAGSKFGPFDGSIYGDFFGSDTDKTGWLTGRIDKKIVVPQAAIDFDLQAAGSKLAEQYKQPLQAKSLAAYLRALESLKPNPATVIEKRKIFIGAPTAATLDERFGLAAGSDTKFRYVKDSKFSPEAQGISPSLGSDLYTNTGDVVCDGDMFVRGTLFLNRLTLATLNGCRIYATGPIFVQNEITYKNLGGPEDKTNLQLVSAQAILLGIGNKSCDTSDKDSPLSRRLVSGYAISTVFTREASAKSIAPKENGQGIYEQGMKISALEDSSCREGAPGFTRLLLNAPQVHNRYKGKFKGLVITEFALFRLGNSNFEFDPVFKEVPVLPRLRDSDYLEVQ